MTLLRPGPATAVVPDERTRARRLSGPVLLAAGLVAASLALHLRDPHREGSWGLCPWLLLTGTYCPGCGGLRAVNDLTHLDVAGALSSNAVAVVLVGLLAAWWAAWAWSAVTRRTLPWGRWVTPLRVYAGLAVVLAFAVLRNVHGFESLGP